LIFAIPPRRVTIEIRPLVSAPRRRLQRLVDRHPGDRQVAAEVGLREDADGVSGPIQFARRRADAALPPVADGAGAGADGALGHRTASRSANRLEHVLARDVEAANVVQPAVVGFADQRVHRSDLLVAGLRDRVACDRVDRSADAQRVRQHDRCFNRAELGDLRRSRQLPKRVADEHGAGHLVLKHVAAVRHDRRHAGADAVALHDRGVADPDAVHVGNRVEWAGRVDAGRDADVARPWPGRLRRGRADNNCRDRCDRSKPISSFHVCLSLTCQA
jgi:hypothetical protein